MSSDGKEVMSCRVGSTAVWARPIRYFLFLVLLVVSPATSQAQTPTATPTPQRSSGRTPSLERHFIKNIFKDQAGIWSLPFRLRTSDARWLAPLGGATALAIATDRRTAGALDNYDPRIDASRVVSYFGKAYAPLGIAGAFYVGGRMFGNARARETGVLEAEALINGGIVAQVLKFATRRPRPLSGDGHGRFFTGGNSFPSGHAETAWAFATVIADEYGKHHPLVRYGIYGLAAAVSISRFTGQNHFLSDILVGSAIGYGVGHFVYLKHHDPGLDAPAGTKPTTWLQKYFPMVGAQYSPAQHVYGVRLAWNF